MRPVNLVLSLAAAAALTSLVACAPRLEGRYRISGDFEQPQYARFRGDLHVDDQGQGHVLLDLADHPSVRVPLCRVERSEDAISFVIERAYPPGRTCDGIARPLALRGSFGGHVIAGEVRDETGRAVGLWRATRKLD
jgi:hypothetical protein